MLVFYFTQQLARVLSATPAVSRQNSSDWWCYGQSPRALCAPAVTQKLDSVASSCKYPQCPTSAARLFLHVAIASLSVNSISRTLFTIWHVTGHFGEVSLVNKCIGTDKQIQTLHHYDITASRKIYQPYQTFIDNTQLLITTVFKDFPDSWITSSKFQDISG